MFDTYILCCTPRTGSTLLCEMLTSAGVAGIPHSYFRAQDMTSRAKAWDVINEEGGYDFSNYLDALREQMSSANGVLGLRVMWGTLDEILNEAAKIYPSVPADNQQELLEHIFGRIKFIYLCRSDIVSQSISLLRAEQTDYWHSTQVQAAESELNYTFSGISARVEMLGSHNDAWLGWFQSVGVTPLQITYEQLNLDPENVTRQVLNYLGLDLPPNVKLSAPNQRLADEITQDWKRRYTNDLRATT